MESRISSLERAFVYLRREIQAIRRSRTDDEAQPCETPAIRWLRGHLKDGSPCVVRMVDLGSELPCYDGHNNTFEGYTTLFSINGDRWRHSQIDRRFVDLDPTARFTVEVSALKRMNVAVETLREGRSGKLWLRGASQAEREL